MTHILKRRFTSATADAPLPVTNRRPSPGQPKAHKATADMPQGTLVILPGGFGFVHHDKGSVFVRASELVRYLPGDVVTFEQTLIGGKAEAKLTGLVRRSASLWLGEVVVDAQGQRFVPDTPLTLAVDVEPLAYVPPGTVIGVTLPPLASQQIPPPRMTGHISAVLGPRSTPGFLEEYALLSQGFTKAFSAKALAETVRLTQLGLDVPAVLAEGVEDLRALAFITIDGESTRDVDDAVFAKETPAGLEVHIAIADVSYYAPAGSTLDQEASRRSTSVYLPQQVVPMLPEALSTGLCSLTAGAPRRAVVLSLLLTPEGHPTSAHIRRALIQSRAQLNYTEVNAWLSASGSASNPPEPEVLTTLAALHKGYTWLCAKREPLGILDFDDPEPSLTDGRLGWSLRNEAHRLVEQYMILANTLAAELMAARYGAALYRMQPPPDQEDWDDLRAWANAKGVTLRETPHLPDMHTLANTPAVAAASRSKIRMSMRPASYQFAPQNPLEALENSAQGDIGHFSLGLKTYTHFTSPIRRYPDLLVHQLLLAPPGAQLSPEQRETLHGRAGYCTRRARAAHTAERYVWDTLKQAAWLTEGGAAEGVVNKANSTGLRLLLSKWQLQATIPAAVLRQYGYVFKDKAWRRATECVQLGQSLTVTKPIPHAIHPGLHEIHCECPTLAKTS